MQPPLSQMPKPSTSGAKAIDDQPSSFSSHHRAACKPPITRPIQGAKRAMRLNCGGGRGQAGSTV